jgi:Cu/Ag efflux pump CusA
MDDCPNKQTHIISMDLTLLIHLRLTSINQPINQMKKWILVGIVLLAGIITNPIQGIAQEVKVEMSKAEKKAIKQDKKLQDAKVKLGKNIEKLQKFEVKLTKTQVKFEKDNAAEKLSPSDVEKITKKIGKQRKSIEKLENDIEKLEKFIEENEDGI